MKLQEPFTICFASHVRYIGSICMSCNTKGFTVGEPSEVSSLPSQPKSYGEVSDLWHDVQWPCLFRVQALSLKEPRATMIQEPNALFSGDNPVPSPVSAIIMTFYSERILKSIRLAAPRLTEFIVLEGKPPVRVPPHELLRAFADYLSLKVQPCDYIETASFLRYSWWCAACSFRWAY